MSSYKCSKCSFISKYKGNAENHVRGVCVGATIIADIVIIKCEICGKETETEKLMALHKKNCVKKRVHIINNDIDGDLKSLCEKLLKFISSNREEIETLKNEFKSLSEFNKKLEQDNKDLIIRLEKLEAKKVEKRITYKKCKPNSGNECSYSKKIEFIPNSQEHIIQKLRENNLDHEERNLVMTISGQRSNEVIGNAEDRDFIEIDGVNYYYDKTRKWGKGVKYADELKIILTKRLCKNDAVYEAENDTYYCEEHCH